MEPGSSRSFEISFIQHTLTCLPEPFIINSISLSISVFRAGPLSEVQTAIGLDATMPCELIPTSNIGGGSPDKVQLVIWYKEGNAKPIYTWVQSKSRSCLPVGMRRKEGTHGSGGGFNRRPTWPLKESKLFFRKKPQLILINNATVFRVEVQGSRIVLWIACRWRMRGMRRVSVRQLEDGFFECGSSISISLSLFHSIKIDREEKWGSLVWLWRDGWRWLGSWRSFLSCPVLSVCPAARNTETTRKFIIRSIQYFFPLCSFFLVRPTSTR